MKKLLLTISLMLMTSGAMAVLTSPDPDLISDRGMQLLRKLACEPCLPPIPYDTSTIQVKKLGMQAVRCSHFSEISHRDIRISGWGRPLTPSDFSPGGILFEMDIKRNRFFLPTGKFRPNPVGLTLKELDEVLRQDFMERVDYRHHPDFQKVADRRTGKTISDILQTMKVHQRDALASLIFDVGLDRFHRSRLLEGIIKKDTNMILEGFADFADRPDSYLGAKKIQRRFVEIGVFTGNPMPKIASVRPSVHYKIQGGRGLDALWADLAQSQWCALGAPDYFVNKVYKNSNHHPFVMGRLL